MATPYRLYLDESGDHTYRDLTNLEKRYLGLTGVLVPRQSYDEKLQPALEELKRAHFTYDADKPPVLVRSQIVRHRGPFWRLRDPGNNQRWCDDLISFIESHDFLVYTVVIDKKTHFETYSTSSFNPYEYSMRALLNRVRGLQVYYRQGQSVGVMAEARGKREDSQLRNDYELFRNLGDERRTGAEVRATYPEVIDFRRKDHNVAGLQLADLIAYPQKMDIVERNGRPMHAQLSAFSKRLNDALESKIMGQYGRVLLN
ncbi:MAG: DUF3800 domain-containing protein [Dehalococcoidia bacterium]